MNASLPSLGCALLLVSGLLAGRATAESPGLLNGFALNRATIPITEIRAGGPPRDGIPALDHPATLSREASPWHEDEMVIGLRIGDEARAYPIAILNWHELVNDTLGGQPVLISFCPLCGTGMVFDRRVAGTPRSFGVSGLLYRSDLLLYDRETESLWSQIASTAVTGPASGERLKVLRSQLTTWGLWSKEHPQTRVLSLETGHRRDYTRSPYAGYAESKQLYFPAPLDQRYHPKLPTLGLRLPSGEARGYPADELVRAGGRLEEDFAGHPVIVTYDDRYRVFDVEVDPAVEVIEGFWFAWSAFHPDASVFTVNGDPASGSKILLEE